VLYVCAARFDVKENFKKFLVFKVTKASGGLSLSEDYHCHRGCVVARQFPVARERQCRSSGPKSKPSD